VGFFIWLIFINKLNVMSIEKIRERIKMIEENNFEINEIININPSDLSHIMTGMTKNDRSDFLGNVGKGDAAYNRIKNRADDFFSTTSRFNVSDCKEGDIPNNDINNVKQIYKILNKYKILTSEINPNKNFDSTNGYLVCDNIIKSSEDGYIQLEYDSDKLTNLKYVYAILPTTKTPGNDMKAKNEIMNLKTFVANCEINVKKITTIKITVK